MFRFIIFLSSLFIFIISTIGVVCSVVIEINWIAQIFFLLLSGYILYWSVNGNV